MKLADLLKVSKLSLNRKIHKNFMLQIVNERILYLGTNQKNITTMEMNAYDCNDMNANHGCVTLHLKVKNDWEDMIKLYYPGGIPGGKTYPIAVIDTTMDCNTKCVRFIFDPSTSDNNDIKVFMDDYKLEGEKNENGELVSNGKYSIQLFKGLIDLKSPDTLEFFKAKESGSPTIVFRAFKNGNPVYYGDLTSQFPIMNL
jgi:hypothetical protein